MPCLLTGHDGECDLTLLTRVEPDGAGAPPDPIYLERHLDRPALPTDVTHHDAEGSPAAGPGHHPHRLQELKARRSGGDPGRGHAVGHPNLVEAACVEALRTESHRPRLALTQPQPPAAGLHAVHGRGGLHESGPALVRESYRQGQLPARISHLRHLQFGVTAWPSRRHDCADRNPVGDCRRVRTPSAGKSGQVHGGAGLPLHAHQRPGNRLCIAVSQAHVPGIPDQDQRARTCAIHVQSLNRQPPRVLEQQTRPPSCLLADAHVLQAQAIHEPAVQPRRSIRRVLQRDVAQRDVADRRVRQAVHP